MPLEEWFLSTNDIPLHRSKSITFWACLFLRENESSTSTSKTGFSFYPCKYSVCYKDPCLLAKKVSSLVEWFVKLSIHQNSTNDLRYEYRFLNQQPLG